MNEKIVFYFVRRVLHVPAYYVAKVVQFCSQLISHLQVCNLKSVLQPLVVCQFLLVISISLDKGYSEVQLMPPFNLIDNTAIQSEPAGLFCTVMVLIIVIMNINYNMHWWSACFISVVRRLNLSDCQLVPFSLGIWFLVTWRCIEIMCPFNISYHYIGYWFYNCPRLNLLGSTYSKDLKQMPIL